MASLDAHPECGSLSPKIRRLAAPPKAGNPAPAGPPVLDSTGIFWTANQRHFDRGSGEEDRGQYDRAEYVFGVTGAAAFYRRSCLEDVAFRAERFDGHRCERCGSERSYLDEIVAEDGGRRSYQCSDTGYCVKMRACRGRRSGEAPT